MRVQIVRFGISIAFAGLFAGGLQEHATTISPTLTRTFAASRNYGRLPLSFEVNRGQASAGVKYVARGSGYAIFLTSAKAILSLSKQAPSLSTSLQRQHALDSGADVSAPQQHLPHRNSEFATFQISFEGANKAPRVVGLSELSGKSNYLIGDNPQHWHFNGPHRLP